jgi:cytochrome b561
MTKTEYDGVAKTLHWLIAVAVLTMLALGFLMTSEYVDGHLRSTLLQWHKSLGTSIFLLALVRLGWRLKHPPPALPSYLPQWEKFAAHFSHILLYVLIIVMPLTGWIIISTFPHPSLFFGLFPIPNLPVLSDLPNKKEIREIVVSVHGTLAWSIFLLILVHIGAALKHHFISRNDILMRMAPRSLERFFNWIRGIK